MSLTNLLLGCLALVVGLTVFIASLPSDPDWCAKKGGAYGACHGGKSSVCCYATVRT